MDTLPDQFTVTRTDATLTAYGALVAWSGFLKHLASSNASPRAASVQSQGDAITPARALLAREDVAGFDGPSAAGAVAHFPWWLVPAGQRLAVEERLETVLSRRARAQKPHPRRPLRPSTRSPAASPALDTQDANGVSTIQVYPAIQGVVVVS